MSRLREEAPTGGANWVDTAESTEQNELCVWLKSILFKQLINRITNAPNG